MCRFPAILLIAFLPIVIAPEVKIVKQDVMNICVHEIDVESRAYTACGFGNIDKYHCLMTQNGGYIEICADPIEIPAGKYPLFSTATETIYTEECDSEKYQPIAKMSNKFYQQRCEKEKSVCDMDGEIICTDGGTTADRQCACNYTADYIAYAYQFFNPDMQTCYTSSLQISGCFLDKCKDDRKELNPAYQCVPKCPDGYHRPFWKFDCSRKAGLQETTSVQKSTTTKAPTTTPEPTPVIPTDIQPMPVNPYPKSDIEKHAINTTIIVIIILCIMVVLIIVVRFLSKYCMDVIVPQKSYRFHYEDMVKLKCEIWSIFPMCLLRLSWRREDAEETLDKYIDDRKYSGGNMKEPTLTIQSAHESDEGTYICTLSSVVPFLLSKEARVMLCMPGASPQIPKKHSKATPETPAKHLQVPSLYDDFRHMDSTDNESGLDSKRPIIHIGNYIVGAKNVNIGPNSKIIDEGGYIDSSEAYVSPPPKRKDKKKARRPRRPSRIPVSSEDSSDEYTEKDKLIKPKRRPSGPVHLSYEDETAKYVKPKAYPPTRLLDTQNKIDKDTSASEALKDARTLETHKDARTSETRKDASEASDEDFEGADLRKVHDNAETYDLFKKFILAASNESIGLIKAKVDGKTNDGTGFRAGSKYIITAYHVVEPLIINLWISLLQQVIQYINKDESSQKENWRKVQELLNIQMPIDKAEKRLAKRKELENLLNESDHRRISDLADTVASMNLPNLSREMVLKRGKENFSDNCVIIFNYHKDKETHSKFHISADIPYASKLEDVVVLALDVDGLTKELPKRFLLDFKGCDEGVDKMHIVGYPKSGELILDPSCDIIHDEINLGDTKGKAIKFFKRLNLSEDTIHKMEREFSNCKIEGLKILFHCSNSITGGASGAPGIAQHDHVTKVLAMMQKGCPSLYYNDELSAEDSKKVKPKYLIEKGIAMARLRILMLESGDAEVRKLKDDLFNEELDDGKVIAYKGDQQESPEQRGDILKEFKRSFQLCLHRAYLGVQKDDKKEVIVAITKQEGDSPPLLPAEFGGLSVINKNIRSYREGSKVQREMASSEMNQTHFDKTAEVIQQHTECLMKKYSNLEIVSASSVKFSSGDTKAEYKECIVLYCSAKGIIPKDEEEFPKEIEGYPVDVREGIFLLYMYPASLFARGGFMQQDYIANLRMGCNIGVRGKNVCGSLGGFVEVENVGTCFLTCAHVIHDISTAIQNKQQIWTDSHLDVTQPADSVANGAEGERKCGEHLESVFDNVGDCTVDAALIKVVGERSPVGGDFEPIYPTDVRMLDFDSAPQYTSGETSVPKENRKVIKVGAASGLTRGIVSSKSSSVRIGCGDLEYFASGLYQITPDTPSVFGDMGDSGSFIFTFNGYGVGDKQLQCIGMLIGGTTHAEKPHVYVTPIGPILSAFKNHKIKGLKVFAPLT